MVVLSAVPMVHGPEDHRAFSVVNELFDEAGEHYAQVDRGVPAMGGGFLEGVDGERLQRSMDSPLRTCVLTTPVHPQAPDVEGSLRLLEAFDAVDELGLDTDPLKEFAATVEQQYEELAVRLEVQQEASVHDDRMYV